MPGDYNGTACPKGSPDSDLAWWPHNAAAYEHNRRCQAVARFPRDSIVEHNAWVIAEVFAEWERINSNHMTALLSARL